MKKTLAIFLSVLLICISIAPMGAAVSNPGLATKVLEGEYNPDGAGVTSVTDATFTVVVKAPKVTKLTGVNLYLSFDSSVLAVKSASAAGSYDEAENFIPFFNGLPVSGFKRGSDCEYSFGWVSNDGVTKKVAKDLFYVTFSVIDTTKTETSINLYVDEFLTEDGNDENDIKSTTIIENKIITFNFPEDMTVPTTEVTPTEEGDGEESPDVANDLLQIIRDMLNGNGVTFADFVDAIANILGNAELTDIIERLVDGNIDLQSGFIGILEGFGLDFSMFEDILNKIIEFLAGLFGGGEEGGDATTAVSTTSAGNATTAEGSSSGSEQTGDAGIALAASVCVLGSVAFVLTKKKKETV